MMKSLITFCLLASIINPYKFPVASEPIYTSDFSAGVDGWTDNLGTAAGNIDSIGGQDDNLRFTIDTANSNAHRIIKGSLLTATTNYTVTFDFYIPSTNSDIDGISITESGSGFSQDYGTPSTDTWVEGSVTGTAAGTDLYIRPLEGGSYVVRDTGGDDVFYVRNVVVTEN